jgi:hypothetical protein
MIPCAQRYASQCVQRQYASCSVKTTTTKIVPLPTVQLFAQRNKRDFSSSAHSAKLYASRPSASRASHCARPLPANGHANGRLFVSDQCANSCASCPPVPRHQRRRSLLRRTRWRHRHHRRRHARRLRRSNARAIGRLPLRSCLVSSHGSCEASPIRKLTLE